MLKSQKTLNTWIEIKAATRSLFQFWKMPVEIRILQDWCYQFFYFKLKLNNMEHKMIRFYVGLEEPDYLIADFEQAL